MLRLKSDKFSSPFIRFTLVMEVAKTILSKVMTTEKFSRFGFLIYLASISSFVVVFLNAAMMIGRSFVFSGPSTDIILSRLSSESSYEATT